MIGALREHSWYILGVALFAAGVVRPGPRELRVAFVALGILLLMAEFVASLRRLNEPLEPGFSDAGSAGRVLGDWLKRHATPVRILGLAVASVGTAYGWAAAFGDAISGLESSTQLDRSSTTYPDANAALIGAIICWCGGSLLAAFTVRASGRSARGLRLWTLATIVGGGLIFAVSRMFTAKHIFV